jgi:hypothetical protein
MSFAKVLAQLREAADHRQRGVNPDKAYVDRLDLQELLYHFDRIDTELRTYIPRIRTEGIKLIAQERKRQIEQEGWTAEHDRQHKFGELALVAACYAIPQSLRLASRVIERFWPWWGNEDRATRGTQWYKPCPDNRIRELTKAGALIAAEIDRLLGVDDNEPI